MEFRHQTLDNGLEIVAECNPQAYSAGLGFFVKAGSRDECDANHGVSHFLEHMTFKGTPTRSAADVNRELDEIGSHSNAYTSEEQTVYYATFLPEYFLQSLDILSDIMRPALREDDFDMEKKVILEEIAKYEDQPPFGAHEKCMSLHFGSHPLGRNVLGTIESVSELTRDEMMEYFQQRYSPHNIVVAASGSIDFDQLVAETNKRCGDWKRFEAPRATPAHTDCGSFQAINKELATQQYVSKISNGPAADDDRRYSNRVLSTILGDNSGSRMFWELLDKGLVEYAEMGSYEYQGTGIMMTFLCCAPRDATDNIRRIDEIFAIAESDGVSDEELARAKSKIRSHIVLQSERPGNRMFAVGSNWIQRGQYRTVREIIDAYSAVTVEDIANVMRDFPLTKNTTVSVGPTVDLDIS